jgi:hypothetical protein
MLQTIDASISLWDDIPGIAQEWQRIVIATGLCGVQVHDANHAASAICHGATQILTLDQRDFQRFIRFGISPVSTNDV